MVNVGERGVRVVPESKHVPNQTESVEDSASANFGPEFSDAFDNLFGDFVDGDAFWRERFLESDHPLTGCLDRLVALEAVLEARSPEGMPYLFSRSTLAFLRDAEAYALVPGLPFGTGFRKVIDLDAVVIALRMRLARGPSRSYAFENVLKTFSFGGGWGTEMSEDPAGKRNPGVTALGPDVVEALALAANVAMHEPNELAPVRLDDFIFGLLSVAAARAARLSRALGTVPGVAQAAALRADVQSVLAPLANALERPAAERFAETAPGRWSPLPKSDEPPDYCPDRPIRALENDLLEFGEDARALAELICLEDAGARAVGVFGDWGSGKSSMLNLVEGQIDSLLDHKRTAGRDTQAEDPFIDRVEHVRFNVWQYNDRELMLALVDETREQLRDRTAIDRLQTDLEIDLKRFREDRDRGKSALEAAEARRKEAVHRIDKADAAAEAANTATREAAQREVTGLLRHSGAGASAAADLLALADTGKALFSTLSLAKSRYLLAANAGYWLAAIGMAGLLVLATWWVLGASGWFAAGVAGLLGFAAPFAKFLGSLNDALLGYARAVETADRAHAEAVADARRESDAALDEIAEETFKVRAAVDKVATYASGDADALWQYHLHDDPQAKEIGKARGITKLVQSRFEALDQTISNGRAEPSEASRGLPDRIVFYIDELDRCRANQVVRMLEAIHLLLAFDNFAVVVAVDERWLVASLESVFRDELARPGGDRIDDRGEITAHEYVEKIIQVPVQVRPLAYEVAENGLPGGSFVNLIDDLTSGAVVQEEEADEADIEVDGERDLERIAPLPVDPQEVLPETTLQAAEERARLTPEEVAGLRQMGVFVGTSPRTVKRFVNIYRLVRALKTGAAFDEFMKSGFVRVQICLAIQCGMDPRDADRVGAWLHGDATETKPESLLGFLEPGGTALLASGSASPEGLAEFRRAWRECERFTFWSRASV